MKKFLSKVGTLLVGVLGFCFVAVVLVYSFKSTFFHSVNEDVERKQEELDAREEKDYQETIVWADSSTKYYHLDQNCKGVHDLYTDKMYLYQAEQEGYKPCNFCW